MKRGLPVAWLLASLLLLVLLLPIAAPFFVRFDENRLIRQTEETLLVEAATIGEIYRALALPAWRADRLPEPVKGERYQPFALTLDLRTTPILPRAERDVRPARTASTVAARPGTIVGSPLAGSRVASSTASTSSIAAILDGVLERAQVRTLSGLRVLDANGVVIASPSHERGYSLAHLDEVASALQGRYVPALRERVNDEPKPPLSSVERASDVRVSLAWPIYADPRATSGPVIGVVYASRTPLDLGRSWWRLRKALIVPVFLSIAGVLAVLAFLVRVIARPLARLTKAALAVADGDIEAPLESSGIAPAEIHHLGRALARMRDQLERRAEYVRVFAAQAVHELKTPLTSLRGASELLLDGAESMPPEQQRRFFALIHDDALRMDKLVGRILDLARIEASPPARRPIALKPWVDAIVERYARHGQTVVLDWKADPAPLAVDTDQIDSLLTNLLDNAARHGEGRPIHLLAEDQRGALRLTVEDDGPLLPSEHFARIFERFYTTERAKGGTGLGLAIVRAVAESHGGTVVASARPEGGARFVVTLPSKM